MIDQQTLLIRAHVEASKAIADMTKLARATSATGTAMVQANTQMVRMNQTTEASRRQFKNARGVMQQFGYQVADLAIVMQNGQNAFMAFGIQGGQLLGTLGPIGAILGLIATVGGLTVATLQRMREEGQALNPVFEGILNVIDSISTYLKVVTIPNIKLFIQDLRTLWQTSEEFRSIVIILATVLVARLVPAIIATSRALIALALSNPFTALALAAVAAAVAIINNWDKVKVIFTYGLPAALAFAQSGFYALKAAGIDAMAGIARTVSDLVNGPLNSLNLIANKIANTFRILTNKDTIPFEEVTAFEGVIANLESSYRSATIAQDQFYQRGLILTEDMMAKLDAINKKRAEGFELSRQEQQLLESSGGGGGGNVGRGSGGVTDPTIYEDWGRAMDQHVNSSLDRMIDAFVEGKFAFREFAQSFLADIAKMTIKAIALYQIQRMLGLATGPMTATSPVGLFTSMFPGFAKGGAFKGGVQMFANGGVVGSPTMFPMKGSGVGVMGEAGPEAIMPLQRDSQGRLGVSGPKVEINNYTGAAITVTRSDDEVIQIAVEQARKTIASDFSRSMNTGQGPYARSLEGGYSARRRTS